MVPIQSTQGEVTFVTCSGRRKIEIRKRPMASCSFKYSSKMVDFGLAKAPPHHEVWNILWRLLLIQFDTFIFSDVMEEIYNFNEPNRSLVNREIFCSWRYCVRAKKFFIHLFRSNYFLFFDICLNYMILLLNSLLICFYNSVI